MASERSVPMGGLEGVTAAVWLQRFCLGGLSHRQLSHIVCELHMETVVWELVSACSTQPCLKDDFLLCSDAYLREAIQILSK